MRTKYLALIVLCVVVIFAVASCPERTQVGQTPEKRAEPEVSIPAMIPPVVERENVGDVFMRTTTTRGGDRIVTTGRWVVESVSIFPTRDLKEGDWIDLITVRVDEKSVFQYLCVAESRECRRVVKARKLLPHELEGAALREHLLTR